MEGTVLRQWEETEAEVEEVSLLKRESHTHISTTTITTGNGDDIEAVENTNGYSGLSSGGLEFSQSKVDFGDEKSYVSTWKATATSLKHGYIEKNTVLPASDPPISEDSTSFNNMTVESERVSIIKGNEQELYLERVFQKPPTQGFYCPNCNACIEKVLIYNREREDTIRCASCLSFLILIGNWFWVFPRSVPDEDEAPTDAGLQPVLGHSEEEPHDKATEAAPENKVPAPVPSVEESQSVASKSSELADSPNQSSEIQKDEHGEGGSRKETSVADWPIIAMASAATIDKEPEIGVSENLKQQPPLEQVIFVTEYPALPRSTIDVTTTQKVGVEEPGISKTWEILKSIVYGGLIEYIGSLSIVTSAASADATTLNIIALSFANLIGGLFIIVHNLWELKSERPSLANNQTNSLVDRYYQLLGQRENFFLHISVAILSFLIFGLVPPMVYGFTFYESNNKDLKLAAVAAASLLCITLLAIAKVYIQRPVKYLTYFKTVLFYLSTGAMASVVAYLVGVLIKKLIEKLGWFDSSSSFTLLLPEVSLEKPSFESY